MYICWFANGTEYIEIQVFEYLPIGGVPIALFSHCSRAANVGQFLERGKKPYDGV